MSTSLLSRPSSLLPVNPVRVVSRLAQQTRLWESLVEFDPDERWYASIAAGPGWEAWLLSWLPGQGTGWHDHGGSAGAFTVLRGALTEQTAQHDPDDATVATAQTGARELLAGDVRSFGRQHLHLVTNRAHGPAVSLHVYAPGLSTMHDYLPDENADRRLRRSATRRAGSGW